MSSDSNYNPASRLDVSIFPGRCDPGSKLRLMTGWLRQWMIVHFADSLNIYDQKKKNVWVWRQDPNKKGEADPVSSGIVIEPNTRYDTAFTETRPAVIIKRQKWRKQRFGINDQLLGEVGPNGEMYFANYWLGAHTLFCIASEPVEAEMLAIEVYTELNEFASAFRKGVNLMRFEVTDVDEIGILEESGQSFVVPVTIAYAVEESWTLRSEAPFLQRFDAALMGL